MGGAMEGHEDKVLIIGAGIAGLALAQILRRHGIPFEIFERTAAVRQKKEGWAVGLMEILPLFAQHLPADLGDIRQTSVNWNVREPDSLGIVDGKTGKLLAKLGGVERDQKGFFLRANRELLRAYLAQHLSVNTSKNFVAYSEEPSHVSAHFSDGSIAHGRILVGADGAYSLLRTQLLGKDHVPELSRNIPMNGLCDLSRAQYEELRKLGNATSFAAVPGVFFNVG